MRGKLRPVGSKVALPSSVPISLPWEEHYHTEFCASGTDALAISVGIAISRKPAIVRPEVIIPAYGCPDLVSAIFSQGAKPVLVDVLRESPFLDDHLLRESVSESTVAVVAVGFLGIPDRLGVLYQICRKHNLLLIEDSAQCFPPASSTEPLADCIVVSFGRGKPINLLGGGALLCSNKVLEDNWTKIESYPKLTCNVGVFWYLKRMVFNLLLTRKLFAILEQLPLLGVGHTKFRPHKATFRYQLPQDLVFGGIKEYIRRPLIHRWYDKHLEFLEQSGWRLLNEKNLGVGSSGTSFPMLRYGILAPNISVRNEAVKALNSAGIGANALYGLALHAINGVESVRINGNAEADDFASRLLTLPCHEDVTEPDLNQIASVLTRFVQ